MSPEKFITVSELIKEEAFFILLVGMNPEKFIPVSELIKVRSSSHFWQV